MERIFLKEALKIAAKNFVLVLACTMAVAGFSVGVLSYLKTNDKPQQTPCETCETCVRMGEVMVTQAKVNSALMSTVDTLKEKLAKAAEWRKIAEFKHLVCDTERALRLKN